MLSGDVGMRAPQSVIGSDDGPSQNSPVRPREDRQGPRSRESEDVGEETVG